MKMGKTLSAVKSTKACTSYTLCWPIVTASIQQYAEMLVGGTSYRVPTKPIPRVDGLCLVIGS